MLNFNWLADLPITAARIIVLLAFLVPLIFAFILPRTYIYLGARDQKKWRNLKWWILGLIMIQTAIYTIF